jgi:hypothetical protein
VTPQKERSKFSRYHLRRPLAYQLPLHKPIQAGKKLEARTALPPVVVKKASVTIRHMFCDSTSACQPEDTTTSGTKIVFAVLG